MTNQERSTTEITALLQAHAAGDAAALEQLLPRVYDELRRIARNRLRRERAGHTLAATELVHEAFSSSCRSNASTGAAAPISLRSPRARCATSSSITRSAGVRRSAARERPSIPLEDADATTEQPLDDLIALSEALDRLERLDARQAQVVECRFFGGLSLDETAEALNTSPPR